MEKASEMGTWIQRLPSTLPVSRFEVLSWWAQARCAAKGLHAKKNPVLTQKHRYGRGRHPHLCLRPHCSS